MITRSLDLKPATDALKESWAMWYSMKQPDIEKAALDMDDSKKRKLLEDLKQKINDDVLRLKNGQWDNFYHFISHAMGRSLLYETKPSIFDIDFVIKAWSSIDDKVLKKSDKRFISAVYYNLACFILKKDPNGQPDQAVELLKKAKKAFEDRRDDFIIDAKLKTSLNSIDSNHIEVNNYDSKQAANLVIQNDSNGVIIENFLKNITELLNKLENRNMDNDMKILDKDVKDLFQAEQDPIMSREIALFIADGHYQCFDVKEEPKKNHWGGFWCFLLGVGQLVGGVALCVFSAGFASTVGMALITEGISDCIEGAIGMITGTFSWVSWAIGKAISLATSLLCFGVGKAVKWFKTGVSPFKNIGSLGSKFISSFTVKGAKESLKQALKYTAKQVIIKGAMTLVDKGIELMVEQATRDIVDTFRQDFEQSILRSSRIKDIIEKTIMAQADVRKNSGMTLTDPVLKNVKAEVKEAHTVILNEAFCKVTKNHDGWRDFSAIFAKVTGPLFEITERNVGNDKAKIVAAVSKAMTLVFAAGTSILEIKEIIQVKDDLVDIFEKETMSIFPYADANEHESSYQEDEKDSLQALVTECHKNLATKFGEMFAEKITSVACGSFTSTLRSFAMQKMQKKMTSLTNLHKQEGYFREKKHQYKQFTSEKFKDFKPSNKTVDEIISEKEGKPADTTDLAALEKKLGKKVIVDTYDERGNKIKSDATTGNYQEEIRVKLTKVKGEDGQYKGHYDVINSDGSISSNQGENNTCLYQAMCQATGEHSSREDLLNAAANLKESSLRGLGEEHLQSLHARDSIFNEDMKNSDREFSLQGGNRSKKSFDRNHGIQLKTYDDDVNEILAYFKEEGVKHQDIREAIQEMSKCSERAFYEKYIVNDHRDIAGKTDYRIHIIKNMDYAISVSFPQGKDAGGLRALFKQNKDGTYRLYGYTKNHDYDSMAANKRAFQEEIHRVDGKIQLKKKK